MHTGSPILGQVYSARNTGHMQMWDPQLHSNCPSCHWWKLKRAKFLETYLILLTMCPSVLEKKCCINFLDKFSVGKKCPFCQCVRHQKSASKCVARMKRMGMEGEPKSFLLQFPFCPDSRWEAQMSLGEWDTVPKVPTTNTWWRYRNKIWSLKKKICNAVIAQYLCHPKCCRKWYVEQADRSNLIHNHKQSDIKAISQKSQWYDTQSGKNKAQWTFLCLNSCQIFEETKKVLKTKTKNMIKIQNFLRRRKNTNIPQEA